jgi:hypothetical protein
MLCSLEYKFLITGCEVSCPLNNVTIQFILLTQKNHCPYFSVFLQVINILYFYWRVSNLALGPIRPSVLSLIRVQ